MAQRFEHKCTRKSTGHAELSLSSHGSCAQNQGSISWLLTLWRRYWMKALRRHNAHVYNRRVATSLFLSCNMHPIWCICLFPRKLRGILHPWCFCNIRARFPQIAVPSMGSKSCPSPSLLSQRPQCLHCALWEPFHLGHFDGLKRRLKRYRGNLMNRDSQMPYSKVDPPTSYNWGHNSYK